MCMCYTRLVTETEKMYHCGFSLNSRLPSTAVRVHCPLMWPLPEMPVGVGDGGPRCPWPPPPGHMASGPLTRASVTQMPCLNWAVERCPGWVWNPSQDLLTVGSALQSLQIGEFWIWEARASCVGNHSSCLSSLYFPAFWWAHQVCYKCLHAESKKQWENYLNCASPPISHKQEQRGSSCRTSICPPRFGWLWEPLCFRDSIARVWYDLFLRFLPPTLACQLLEQQGNASSSFVFPAKSLFSFVQGTQ